MANDVLAFVLYDYEKEGKGIPVPSKAENVKKKRKNLLIMWHVILWNMRGCMIIKP